MFIDDVIAGRGSRMYSEVLGCALLRFSQMP